MMGHVLQRPDVSPDLQKYVNILAEEYEAVMLTGMAQHERSQQKLIGPSEIGVECDRALLYKLAQAPEPPEEPGRGWKPTVGTALHAQQEHWYGTVTTPNGTTPGDWEVEQKVAVGTVGPDTIKGSTDLYARSGCVIDHKFVGKYKLQLVRAHDYPGKQYQVQAHTYGRGWVLDGFPVHAVMIVFHPREGELTDSYYWWEPYNEFIPADALARANNRYTLLESFGLEQALTLFPYCADKWCDWCNWDKKSRPYPSA